MSHPQHDAPGCRAGVKPKRKRPVARSQRTHGWRHQADLQFSGLRWSEWQLCKVLPAQPAPALGQAPRHPAGDCCSPRRTRPAHCLRPAPPKFDHSEALNRRGKPVAGAARGPVLRDPQLAIGAAPENAGPMFMARASEKALVHRPAHAERKPELLFKPLIARLVLLELPPRLAVNREHHTASPIRDGIGILGPQCVRQLIQQG